MKQLVMLTTLALATVACGPSVRPLVEARHYREAVCAANDGVEPALVRSALARDSAIAVHAQRVNHGQLDALEARLPGDPPVSVSLLRIDAQSNALPLDGLELEVSVAGRSSGVIARPATFERFVELTRERLPPHHTTLSWWNEANSLRGLAALATGGVSLLFAPFRQEAVSIPPSAYELARAAPRATALLALTNGAGCRAHVDGVRGARCRWYWLVVAAPDAEVELSLSARASADRTERRRDEDRCSLTVRAEVSLGPARRLGATLDRMFDGRALPLVELTRAP
jgi:hypothetical protein